MITIIAKKYVNGRYIDFDAHEMYAIDQIITLNNNTKYKVTNITGSRVTFEEVIENEWLSKNE